jgi:hypothetical protein
VLRTGRQRVGLSALLVGYYDGADQISQLSGVSMSSCRVMKGLPARHPAG